MENKKYLPIRLIHAALMLVVLLISIISMVNVLQTEVGEQNTMFYFLVNITKILALLSGIYYIVNGYKKADANYYKMFVFFLLAYEVIYAGDVLTSSVEQLYVYCELISLVLITVMGIGKDLGKKNTLIYAGIILVCKVVICVNNTKVALANGPLNLATIGSLATNVILALTIILMAIGKYIDKKQRGR